MMTTVKVEPITEEAFAPFGQLLPAPETGKGRLELIEELQNLRGAAKPRLSLVAVHPKPLPLTAVEMERHMFSSQAFVPCDCSSYLVLVAPHGDDDMPDASALKAFRVPGNVGINYRADTWHHPLTALDGPARFVVLTFIEGTANDEQFVPLSEPVTVALEFE
jgi:ureidoglycolate lyase